jgi:hypothetical protein
MSEIRKPKGRSAARQVPRVFATLDEVRMLQERSQIESSDLQGGMTFNVLATARMDAGVAFVALPDGAQRLIIAIDYTVAVNESEKKTLLMSYFNKYQGTFLVDEIVGIDFKKGDDVPVEALQTYVNQIEWMVRSRAQNAMIQYGFAGIALPKAGKLTPKLQFTEQK